MTGFDCAGSGGCRTDMDAHPFSDFLLSKMGIFESMFFSG